jgi:CheY-like chemotaxis protein
MFHIVVCDDDRSITEYLKETLEKKYRRKIECQCVYSAEELLKWLEDLDQGHTNIIILDIALGDDDGIAIAKEIVTLHGGEIWAVSNKEDTMYLRQIPSIFFPSRSMNRSCSPLWKKQWILYSIRRSRRSPLREVAERSIASKWKISCIWRQVTETAAFIQTKGIVLKQPQS